MRRNGTSYYASQPYYYYPSPVYAQPGYGYAQALRVSAGLCGATATTELRGGRHSDGRAGGGINWRRLPSRLGRGGHWSGGRPGRGQRRGGRRAKAGTEMGRGTARSRTAATGGPGLPARPGVCARGCAGTPSDPVSGQPELGWPGSGRAARAGCAEVLIVKTPTHNIMKSFRTRISIPICGAAMAVLAAGCASSGVKNPSGRGRHAHERGRTGLRGRHGHRVAGPGER